MGKDSIKVIDKGSRAPFFGFFCYQEYLLRHRIAPEDSRQEEDAENAKSNKKEEKKIDKRLLFNAK